MFFSLVEVQVAETDMLVVVEAGQATPKHNKKSSISSALIILGIKDGEAIKVTPGQQIRIVVGSGGRRRGFYVRA